MVVLCLVCIDYLILLIVIHDSVVRFGGLLRIDDLVRGEFSAISSQRGAHYFAWDAGIVHQCGGHGLACLRCLGQAVSLGIGGLNRLAVIRALNLVIQANFICPSGMVAF